MRVERGEAAPIVEPERPRVEAVEPRAPFVAPAARPSAPELSPAFKAQVAATARRLGVDPAHLLAVMWFESRLSPTAKNPMSNAVGLIQFMPFVAADLLGLPRGQGREARATAMVAQMSAEEQLGLVEAYLARVTNGRPITTLRDLYMCVLFPSAVGRGAGFVIARADDPTPLGRAIYAQNAALDANHDGVITAGDAAAAVEGAAWSSTLKKIVAEVTASPLPSNALRA